MSERVCEFCGKQYVGVRKNSTYCSDICRARAAKARKGSSPVAEVPSLPGASNPVQDAVRAELEAAGVLNTAAGAAAVALAEVADNPSTGDAPRVTALRSLPAAIAAALASKRRVDQVDEVARRRDDILRKARGA